ncbi:TlpA disulfide reductase family protein [Roseobacter sp. N2S]|uniref:TlpA disulfide reductase family protein n=1 Tax=Roseobacter sp. N2S TaxID=2663844 RepID=UPI0028635697|nr:TlpA disulfide reductase family protein [Roseobacter sp. N2S]MDR6263704.1 thiol-disulfide isomerase/thioredoxin [Roseobacter sp. N2S]
MTLKKALAAAVLYAAGATIANPVLAAEPDIAALIEMRQGDMKKLAFTETPADAVETGFVDAADAPFSFSDFQGKYLLVNFWATWCAPCRHEMPTLDALQKTYGGDDFQVVAIATGHNPLPAIEAFFEKAEVENIAIYRDPKQKLAREMSVLGLPMTMILNPQGQEIARLRGDADWFGEDAQAIIRTLIESKKQGS